MWVKLTAEQKADIINQYKSWDKEGALATAKSINSGTTTPTPTETTPTQTTQTTPTTYTNKSEYGGQWGIANQKTVPQDNPYVNQGNGQYNYDNKSWYYVYKNPSTTTSTADSIRSKWESMSYEDQQKALKNMPNLQSALEKYWITNKQQNTQTQFKQSPREDQWDGKYEYNDKTGYYERVDGKWDGWDYQDNSPERMAQILDNLNNLSKTNPWLFANYDAFYNAFIAGKGRSPEQEALLNDYFNNMKKYKQYDNMSSDAIGQWLVNWTVSENYLNYVKYAEPQRYVEIKEERKRGEDTIKSNAFMDTINSINDWADYTSQTSKVIEWLKWQWLLVDKDWNLIDDRTENYANDEELGYQKQIADLNARNLEIDMTMKNTYDDYKEKYPWATKAELMAMAQDTNNDLLREKEDNLVQLTRLQWYVWYMQSERQERNRIWENAINQLQEQYRMYYDYTPEWMSELAQAKYAATNVTLDQADNGTDTQKQMALQSVLDDYYAKYWDIIQRSEAQVINDVMAYANEKWISLSKALDENFTSQLKKKPAYQAMQNQLSWQLSEPNLQIIWYNSDGKAVYGYWDSDTKTFKSVAASWVAGWTSGWNYEWTSYTTNIQPLNNFISDLETKYTIASKWWTWGSKIRGWWCWTVVNDYLWDVWDNIKLKEANDIKPYATSKVPAEWAVAYFDWTQSRATPETKKHGHVWIVVSDNWDTVTVLESNEWTWLRYNDYKKSSVTGYYVPNWIKTNEYTQKEYSNAFTKAWDIVSTWIEWQWNKQMFKETLQWLLDEGDYTWAFEYITITWKNNAKWDAKDKIQAAETAMVDLISIRDALEAYYAAWWDTGILQGSLEKVANKLWNTTDPKLVWLATKISEAIQSYRKNISWTAFSEKEAEEYEALFPTIAAWQEYNNAKLTSTLDSMVIRLNQLYGWLIWPRTYINVLDAHEKATWNRYSMYEQQSQLYNYLWQNWYLNPDWTVKSSDDFASYVKNQQNKRVGKSLEPVLR